MDEEDSLTTYYLDSKVKLAWSLNAIALLLIVWIVASFAFIKLNIPFLGFYPGIAPLVLLVALIIVSLPYFAWVELEYRAFRYGLGETEMRIRKGVIKTETYVVPYEKIQNINIERSPIERLLGLATLRIETAGSNVGESDILLPGVSDYRELVAMVLNKVEKAKHAMEREEMFEKEETRIIERLTMMVSNIGNKMSDIEARISRMQVEIENMKRHREEKEAEEQKREEIKPEIEEKMQEESIKRISPKIRKPKKVQERKKGGKR
ncbi:MAG: PH domain-containing protein [Candidatus Anstonellales archaeon]